MIGETTQTLKIFACFLHSSIGIPITVVWMKIAKMLTFIHLKNQLQKSFY